MPMGLIISPSIWQSYTNAILSCLQSKKYCEAIMDDLILFTPSKESHMNKLEDILSTLLKNGLKMLPKKCQLFRTSLQYMGNEIFIENKKVCVKPLRNRLEAIQRLQPPKTPKGCRSFAGVVNFLNMFCPELQRLLKPIYDLTRKERPFHWRKEQDSFIEIKCRLTKPPVLHMPNKTGRFHLYSDTSKFATGSALYQIQGGKPKLIAYGSKRLSEAARNYSFTELELCGLAINIASFSHLLKRVDFDAIVDHLALTHIIKSKAEPATTRIKRLLELISSYSFNLYYMKGKDMILSDFLSQQGNVDSDPSEIIPISFNVYNILEENRNLGMCKKNEGKFLIQTCCQAKTSGTTLPEVHRGRKKLDPKVRPEKQHALPKKEVTERPHIGQGRAGLRRKPEADHITQSSDVTGRILERSKIAKGKTNIPQHISAMHDRGINNDKSFPPDVPLLPRPLHEPLQKKHNITSPQDMKTEINLDIEENSPFQEGVILELIQRPDKSIFQNPRKLEDVINPDNLVHKFLPKQVDIDKILHAIQMKVLKNTHLPIEIKEIQAGYLHSPYFKDLYQYLLQNKLPHSKPAIKKLEALSERYVLLDSLLFRINPEKETAVLDIPEECVDKIITLYHKSLFVGHQGVIKTYLTISDKFFIPNLIHYLRSYIKGCHTCQLSRNEKLPTRHFQTRINANYVPMSRLSMDLKVMPRSHKGHKYILCVINEVTNFLVMIPLFQARSEEIGEALLEHIIMKNCIPDYIIINQDSAFMSSFMTYLFHRLNIKIKTVAPYNHQSLQAEHGIKSLTHILTKHLTGLGQMWTKYLALATFAYNTFSSPNLGNYSPYELTFGRKPKLLLNTEANPDIKVSRNFKEYYDLLNKRIKYLQDILFNFKL